MIIRGRTILVTGASSGLGRAVASLLHSADANVLLLDTNTAKLSDFAHQLGERAVAVCADVREPEQVKQAVKTAIDRFGRLSVAISCAGISASAKLVSQNEPHDIDVWQKTIDVNLTGTFNVMRYSASAMTKNTPDPETGERGVIINTASVAAFDGQKGQLAYAASKAAIAGMTLPAARDLADKAIRCVAIAPGLFETEMFNQIPEKGVEALKRALLFPSRMGKPAEFARFVEQIICNPYINGSCLRLDGGARLP